MKANKISLNMIAGAIVACIILFNACKVSEEIHAKSGAQLWGENCIRCHNVPSPSDFSDGQWNIIGTHMRVRANLTSEESKKIIEFLKTAN